MPLTKANMETVNALVKAGRIDQARARLSSLEGDKAKAALSKLNARYPLNSKAKRLPSKIYE